jgi:hypothetical protein
MSASAPPFWPLFGLNWPPVPPPPPVSDCGPRAERKRRERGQAARPCATCKGKIAAHSWAICMTCSATAPGKEAVARKHGKAVDSCPVDLRKGTPYEQEQAAARAKAKAAAKAARKPVLTAKDRRALRADARAGDQPLPIVEAFLAAQAKSTATPSALVDSR